MCDDVYVRMNVPLGHPDGDNYPMEFHCWLPLEETDRILVDDGDRSLTISFSTDNPEQDQEAANASIDHVVADLTLRNLSEELIAGIENPPDYSDVSDFHFLENNPHILLALIPTVPHGPNKRADFDVLVNGSNVGFSVNPTEGPFAQPKTNCSRLRPSQGIRISLRSKPAATSSGLWARF